MKCLPLLAATGAIAQSGPWAQCGGKDWTGPSTCVDGYTCKYSNDYYSQCIPGSNKPTSTSSAPSTHPTGPGNAGALKWLGVDESVAEFGDGKFPGVWGVDFRFPDEAAIGTLISEGFNIFRVPFSMERMAPGSITGTFSSAYLTNLTHVVEYITSHGAWAVLDPHNYGRYNGNVIADVSSFKSFWTKLAAAFKANDKVIFDTNNEYHDMDQSLVLQLNQGAIDAIRAAGATSQYIFAEGNSYSGAWTWKQVNDNLKDLKDPQGKLVYEMHQYLDSDGSGTSEACVSSTIGADRVASATQWLRANGKVGVLGEFAGGANSVCKDAVTGLLNHLAGNGDVWMGALWWSAGPWWGNYIYSFEPPSGIGYKYYDGLLRQYVPG